MRYSSVAGRTTIVATMKAISIIFSSVHSESSLFSRSSACDAILVYRFKFQCKRITSPHQRQKDAIFMENISETSLNIYEVEKLLCDR